MHIGRFGIKRDIVEAVTSEEAERVTPNICTLYLRLVTAPEPWWFENHALTIQADSRDGVVRLAWSVLLAHIRVPDETACRALAWLEEKGFITVKYSLDGRTIEILFEGLYFPKDES